MFKNLGERSPAFRWALFITIFGGGLMLIVIITFSLILSSINAEERAPRVALLEGVTVREFAALPDDDAYPAALAVAPDGTVYTGSYASGTIWKITPDGEVAEVPGTRDAVGAVAGLAVGADSALYIVDQLDTDTRTAGGDVKRLRPDGTISTFATITGDERGFIAPDDITLDSAGYVYVSDRGRGEVWRFDAAGQGGSAWWTPPAMEGITAFAPTGLAYDKTNDALLVTDSLNDILFRVSVVDASSLVLYNHKGAENAPGFDGLTITPDGQLYITAQGQRGLVRLEGETLVYVAGLFRGSSDVDASPDGLRLYVTNFDSGSLVIPGTAPRLPFALDVVELGG